VSVAMRESRCQPDARNPSGASGLFQLMMPLHRRLVADVCGEPADDLVFVAACNIAAARALYAGAGRAPWNL
jgi:soluble lytic murein transglycosylase-like protein